MKPKYSIMKQTYHLTADPESGHCFPQARFDQSQVFMHTF